MSEEKPILYLLLGAAGAGRREVVADLIEGGLSAEDKSVVFLPANLAPNDIDSRLGTVVRWTAPDESTVAAAWPEGADVGFFIVDGRRDPVDQIEALKPWIEETGAELTRVICVYHCELAAAHKPLLIWYDACVYFSDIVLLNRRAGLANKWMSELRQRFDKQFMPCLVEMVKKGRVHNPALVLDPLPRRMSHWFDEEEESWTNQIKEMEDTIILEEGEEAVEEETEDEDLYLARLASGRRKRVIPDINDYLPAPQST